MTPFVRASFVLASLFFAAACGSSSSSGSTSGGSSSGSASGGSSSGGSGSTTTLSCIVTITDPECQYYEASGPDAARVIDSLRAGCVDQGGIKASVVDACPTANGLGGCKTPVTVKGGAQATLFVTNFFYQSADGGLLGPHSTDDVKQECSSESSGVFVPAR